LAITKADIAKNKEGIKMKKITVIALLLTTIVCATPLTAKGDAIGFVDMDVIFNAIKESGGIATELKGLEKRKEEYKKRFETLEANLEKEKEKKKPSEERLKTMISEMEAELKPKRDAILRQEMEIQRSIIGKVIETARLEAKKIGIDVVLDKRAVYIGGTDLTEFVIDRLKK
jgi:Skp family chaperone for outer membrane proteins